MTAKDRLYYINLIEDQIPVSSIKFLGLAIWPLIRFHLTFINPLTQGRRSVPPNKIKANSKKLAIVRQGIASFVKDKTEIPDDAPLAFFIDGNSKNELVNGKYEERIMYSLGALCSEKHFSLEHSTPTQTDSHHRINIDWLILKSSIKAIIKRRTKRFDRIAGLDSINNFILENGLGPPVDEAKLIQHALLILEYKKEFSRLLSSNELKAVLFKSYYSPLKMGLILACRSKNIESIEVQHGLGGNYHYMLSNWTKFPRPGYDLLPSTFWCWGTESAKTVQTWADISSDHKVLIGGNPWLSFLNSRSTKGSSLLERLSGVEGKKILVSLQTTSAFEQSHLLKAIRNSPSNFLWILRLHPLRQSDESYYKSELDGISTRKYDFEYANNLPLCDLLEQVDFHVTFWSTTMIEALCAGVPTAIIHENGYDIMKEHIDDASFCYCSNAREILHFLQRPQVAFNPAKASHFMQVSPSLVRETLSRLSR